LNGTGWSKSEPRGGNDEGETVGGRICVDKHLFKGGGEGGDREKGQNNHKEQRGTERQKQKIARL